MDTNLIEAGEYFEDELKTKEDLGGEELGKETK